MNCFCTINGYRARYNIFQNAVYDDPNRSSGRFYIQLAIPNAGVEAPSFKRYSRYVNDGSTGRLYWTNWTNLENSKVSYAFHPYAVPYSCEAGPNIGTTVTINHDAAFDSYQIRQLANYDVGHVYIRPTRVTESSFFLVNDTQYAVTSTLYATILYIKIV